MSPLRENLKDFGLLALAADGKERTFLRNVGSYNMSGTVKIKLLGITWFKIKDKANGRTYYFAGVPVFKTVRVGQRRRRYVLGLRIW